MFIEVPGSRRTPEWQRGQIAISSGDCVMFACLGDQEGETTITLGRSLEFRDLGAPMCEVAIGAPADKLLLMTMTGNQVAEVPVSGRAFQVRFWVEEPDHPARVTIGIDPR